MSSASPLAIGISIVAIIIAILGYILYNKAPADTKDKKDESKDTSNSNNNSNSNNSNSNNSNSNNSNTNNNTPATSTTNGYITNGTIVPITGLPVTISNATYINYTSPIAFTVTGTSTKNNVSSNINSGILANTSYTLVADNVSINLTATPVIDLHSKGESLSSNSSLSIGEYITDGILKLIYQDGELLLTSNGVKVWSSNTKGMSANKVVFDGNLKIINNQNNIVWQTNSPVNSTAKLVFKGTGVDIQDAGQNTAWSSNGGLATLLIDATKAFILRLKGTNVCIDSSKTNNVIWLKSCYSNVTLKDKPNQLLNYTASDQTMYFGDKVTGTEKPTKWLDTNQKKQMIVTSSKPSASSGAWSFDFSLGKLFNPNGSNNSCFDGAGGATIASAHPDNFIYQNDSCQTQGDNQKWDLLYQ